MSVKADRDTIAADGKDLSFITVTVVDDRGREVPTADNELTFSLDGPGEIVATDNGDPTNMVSFKSLVRDAFSGKALVIVRGVPGDAGEITVRVSAEGLEGVQTEVKTQL